MNLTLVRVYPWFNSFLTAGRSSSTTDGHGWARIVFAAGIILPEGAFHEIVLRLLSSVLPLPLSAFQLFSLFSLFSMVVSLCALAWLWFALLNHLRVAWSGNPQYAYGWAVPFLCGYLIWRKVENRKHKVENGGEGTGGRGQLSVIGDQRSVLRHPLRVSAFRSFSFSAFSSSPSSTCQPALSRKPIPNGGWSVGPWPSRWSD